MSTVLTRDRLGLVWLGLVLATVVSFLLGTDHGLSGEQAHKVGVCILLAIAFVKVRFIGMEFMELRDAPLVLKGVFYFWLLATGGMVLVSYLLGS